MGFSSEEPRRSKVHHVDSVENGTRRRFGGGGGTHGSLQGRALVEQGLRVVLGSGLSRLRVAEECGFRQVCQAISPGSIGLAIAGNGVGGATDSLSDQDPEVERRRSLCVATRRKALEQRREGTVSG